MRRRCLILFMLAALLVTFVTPVSAHSDAPAAPVLLIHGLAGSPATTWGAATAWFEQKGYVAGTTIFAIDLGANKGEGRELGLLSDAGYVAAEVRRILKQTGAAQVDLVGNSRGGLIVRLLASGETAPLVRRAVSIDAPHGGVLPAETFYAMLDYAKVAPSYRSLHDQLPGDLRAGSAALRTLAEREARFADRRAPALVLGSTFLDGHADILSGHDGFVGLSSQLAWPGARTATNKIGPTAEQLAASIQGGNLFALIGSIPHVTSPESEAVLTAVYDFLHADEIAAPARACEPNCQDWAQVSGHWSEGTVRPMLPGLLPYSLDEKGQRVFDPRRAMTRAEFVYGLARATGLQEQLDATAFADLRGHWALGYVEAAVAAKLVAGLSADAFGPDQPLTRAQAATLIVRVKKLPTGTNPSRFADARGHWAEANIEAAAENGIIKGDDRGFRPNETLTAAEGAVILSRAFPR